MLNQLDFHGMTKEELTGKDGLSQQLTDRFYKRILNAAMDSISATRSTIMQESITATTATYIVRNGDSG
ncbi:hypothetical protein [Treponema sp. OMZ 857]|uniref:hypothetical protein n=1 Tax=Treponema sp. OMZ 857 TaxID=1643513 RepID=UPI0020A54189|nr:hypothetical protein [Treponema sp. OMZ 857]UTC43746.1 hypothetical protein E4N66_06475 [Treponema sp. OMZ 857]